MSKVVGVLYHPRLAEALELSQQLCDRLQARGHRTWTASVWADEEVRACLPGTDAVVSAGGDGTIMRAARAVIPAPVPVICIKFGRLGFLAEIAPAEALERVPELVEGGGYIEERTMLRAVSTASQPPELEGALHPLMTDGTYHALNDVVVARSTAGRPILARVVVNGQSLTTYRADAVLVATATGSTGYTLSAGGPLLHPTSRSLVLLAVSPHATLHNALVLEPDARVEITIIADHSSVLSVDGQVNIPLQDGDTVQVEASPYRARFLRPDSTDDFYRGLLGRLHFGEDKPV